MSYKVEILPDAENRSLCNFTASSKDIFYTYNRAEKQRILTDSAIYEEFMRELAFELMVGRGLDDSRNDRVIENEEMQDRIRTWQR